MVSTLDILLGLLPVDGQPVGNAKLLDQLSLKLARKISQAEYDRIRDELVSEGRAAKGKGRGGSLRRITEAAGDLVLEAPPPKPVKDAKPVKESKGGARAKSATGNTAEILAYQHKAKRANNPEVGMVTPDSDPDEGVKTWKYDPHIDPALQFDVKRSTIEKVIDDALATSDAAQMRSALDKLRKMSEPYLNWAGKAERTSFEVDTVSLHVHERIDPATILRAIRKRMTKKGEDPVTQSDLFQAWFEAPLPYREAIDFYKHDRGWSNRLIAGDSLLVMNSLLQKEGMAGQVQMIYIDPPYGIKYGSNFQPFIGKRDVKDKSDEDLTQEPEMIRAFRDTWELGVHSYLTHLRDRLLVSRELLASAGSVFVQISEDNLHLVRNLLDDIFGVANFCSLIAFETTTGQTSELLAQTNDFLVWYAKDKKTCVFNPLYRPKLAGEEGGTGYRFVRMANGDERIYSGRLEHGERLFMKGDATSQRQGRPAGEGSAMHFPAVTRGMSYAPRGGRGWSTTSEGMRRLVRANRLVPNGINAAYVRYLEDSPVVPIAASWGDTGSGFMADKVYVVQTNLKVIERCLLMTTSPGDLVLDPTCGSGSTAVVAEKWGRRWITCDTSRVAVTLAKQRLMSSSFDYFTLRHPQEGLRGGFQYSSVPHIGLKAIANNLEIDEIWGRTHPAVAHALVTLNVALRREPPVPFEITEGGREGSLVDFSQVQGATMTLPSGESVQAGALLEWEVPFDWPSQWPASAKSAFDAFHSARHAMEEQMDASIAMQAEQVALLDQPHISKAKLRVTGPFTVEAVPFPSVLSLDEARQPEDADLSVARSGESSRQHLWRDELLKTGIRGKGGQMLRFAQLETLAGTRYLHCSGTLANSGERVVVSFGPEYAALEQRQVELAMRDAGDLFPRPKLVVFCAFTFDPEAAKDIDSTKGIVALKAQMNTDLLTEDLKRARSSNESFWLMGQPDVDVRRRKDGKYEVEVNGFDYFDTTKGELVSGGKAKIAMWLLDTDYDERSLFPRQVFFPMASAKDGWYRLKKDIKAELNVSLLERLHGTVSIPFEAGENKKVAVKIVDDRGIESLKVIPLD